MTFENSFPPFVYLLFSFGSPTNIPYIYELKYAVIWKQFMATIKSIRKRLKQ